MNNNHKNALKNMRLKVLREIALKECQFSHY